MHVKLGHNLIRQGLETYVRNSFFIRAAGIPVNPRLSNVSISKSSVNCRTQKSYS